MTIASQSRTAGPFTGTGLLVSYPFSFKVFTTADLLIQQTDTSGTITPWTLGANYTVVLNADQNVSPGGTVSPLVALPAGYVLNVTSAVALTQGASLTNAGGFFPKTIEDALDRLTILIQQALGSVTGALRVPEITGVAVLPPASQRAGMVLGFDSNGNPVPTSSAIGSVTAFALSLLSFIGATLVGFIQAATGAIARTLQDKGSEIVSVMDFMTTAQKADARAGTTTLDLTAAVQAAFTYAISLAPSMTDGGSVIEPLYTSSAYVGVRFPPGKYLISQAGGVTIPANAGLANLKVFGDPGATIVGNGTTSVDGTNTLFNFNGGAHKNVFKDLLFAHYGTAILVNTANVNECMVQVDSCESKAGATFMDTVSYAASRSTMIHFKDSLFGDTAVVIKHYTDHLTIDNCWLYAKKSSLVAPLFLSGDGIVSINSSFFIPHGVQVSPVANSRWIDMICDSANSGGGDRSVKSLNIRGCRFSLESVRPPIWFSDNNAALPSGANQVCSITIEDTYLGGAGGNPIVTYIKGYPGSVNFRNAKPLASTQIVSANATGAAGGVANTTYPVPSVPGVLTSHVIMIDEATRLALTNSNNAASYVDPLLETFCYDTTSQTSKFKRSIQKNIDYRLAAVAAPGAGSGFVKVSIPVFFDTAQGAPNRDILTFMLVTVSDADGPANSQPHERAQATCLVTIVGGNSGTALKRIIKTVLQDAQGGTSFAVSAVPTVFWGQGDTGSADVAPGTTMGAATNITFAWFGRAPASAWAYIVPLAGLRENQQPLMQSGVW